MAGRTSARSSQVPSSPPKVQQGQSVDPIGKRTRSTRSQSRDLDAKQNAAELRAGKGPRQGVVGRTEDATKGEKGIAGRGKVTRGARGQQKLIA
jgi:hypothetical protein